MSPLGRRQCRWCHKITDPDCPTCELIAEDIAAGPDEIEHLDPWGRDPDWHYPRGTVQ